LGRLMVEDSATGGVEPSRLGEFDDFRTIEMSTVDGAFRSVTSYDGDRPLATLTPFKRPIHLPVVSGETQIRLSRFAYLHRSGHRMLLKTPLTGMDLEIHDPRVGAFLTALAFDTTPGTLAVRVGLSLESAVVIAQQLVAMSAASTVTQSRDRALALGVLIDAALTAGLPQAWDSPRLREVLLQLPWSDVDDEVQLIWELHHDGSCRADVSVTLRRQPVDRLDALSGVAGREFDVTEAGVEPMGTFYRLRTAPLGADPVLWTARACREADVSLDPERNRAVTDLIRALGVPRFIASMERREGVRLLLHIATPEALVSVGEVLARHGVPASVIARLPLLATVARVDQALRLAVDAVGEGIAPAIAFEVFLFDGVAPVVPGLLDSLGLDSSITEQVEDIVARAPAMRDHMLSPGVVTDSLRAAPLHVKVSFAPTGQVSVKTYVELVVTPLTAAGRSVEDRLVPSTWEFHDLLFHSQTRNGRVRHRLGGTARFSVIPEPLQELLPPAPGDLPLDVVDVSTLVKADPPFGEVLRSRQSQRDWSGPAIPLAQLSELLQRVAELIHHESALEGLPQEYTSAPYPSGGGVYETDIVVLAHRVDGLEPGAYLYRRLSRALTPLTGEPGKVDGLLMLAAEACGTGLVRPQALLVLAARFPDLAVKYEGIAYSLMVKHVGVLMATIAYTATAMGLGAVPIGTGDSDEFAAATGLDYYRHGSIGEIALTTMVADPV
jgi:SagB-type dehydrogenase family enzyme